jgi:hypothetical protein
VLQLLAVLEVRVAAIRQSVRQNCRCAEHPVGRTVVGEMFTVSPDSTHEDAMSYPPLIQFETRRREFEDALRLNRERHHRVDAVRRGPWRALG